VRPWQFDVAFVVALVLLAFVTIAPYFGVTVTPDPLVVSGLGMLLGYVFTRRDKITRSKDDDDD
jgi:uncharacterized membrane protein (UPF0136 family)